MGDKNFKWWTADSEDAEVYQGPYSSREEAIGAGEDNYDGEDFYVVEADKMVIASNIHGEDYAEKILEDLTERNEDCFGEDGPGDPWAEYGNPVRSLGMAIESAVKVWLAVNPGKTWCFDTTRNGEIIVGKLAA